MFFFFFLFFPLFPPPPSLFFPFFFFYFSFYFFPFSFFNPPASCFQRPWAGNSAAAAAFPMTEGGLQGARPGLLRRGGVRGEHCMGKQSRVGRLESDRLQERGRERERGKRSY